ncbi:MAG: SBBP repeat-containing protein [Flavobacteriales bacterium]|nr:SBBP repeat-containing protein [Flavobacteriales bacterium]MCB9193801.1 SBBP repeat-containing protein [Flavobacteriales bacterium]
MRSLLPVLCCFCTFALHAQPTFQWAETVPNVVTPGEFTSIVDADVSSDGTVCLTGWSNGPRTIVADTIVGGSFVARYDTSGNCLWAASPGGTAIALSSSNDVYLVGSFSGTMQFAGSMLTAAGQDPFVAKYDANGQQQWARKMGGAQDDKALSVAVDGLGRVHVCGYFQGTATFGPTTLVATHDTTGFHTTLDPNGNFEWAVRAGGLTSWNPFLDHNRAITCDALGNSYVAGVFNGTASFGSTMLTTTGFDQVFLARFDAGGNCSWVQAMGANYGNILRDIAFSTTGGVYVCGNFWGPQGVFGSTTITNTNVNTEELFLACYDANGNGLWAQSIAPSSGYEAFNSLNTDDAGNAWLCGSIPLGSSSQIGSFPIGDDPFLAEFDATGNVLFAGNVIDAFYLRHAGGSGGNHFLFGNYGGTEFDPGSGEVIHAALMSGHEGFLARYHDDLGFHWMRRIGLHGAAYDGATGVAVDPAGNVYSSGNFVTTAILCGDTLRAPLAAMRSWLNKRDANGACVWNKQLRCIEPEAMCNVQAFARAGNGDLLLAGEFTGTLDLTTVQLIANGPGDLFLARFDENGNCLWAINEGGTGSPSAGSVTEAPNGNILLAGSFSGNATIAGNGLVSSGQTDGFIARYDASGNGLWCRSFGGASWENGSGIAVDSAGNAYVTGRFTTSATFDALTVNGAGDADLYLAKYDPNGNLVWLTGSTGAGWKQATSVVVGTSGQVYITGQYTGEMTICTNTLVGDNTTPHPFLSCFSANGGLLWQHDYPCSGGGSGSNIAARPGGDIVLTGGFSGDLTVDGFILNAQGAADAWVAAFNSAGDALWAHAMSGTDPLWDFASGLDLDADANNVIVSGSFGDFYFTAFDQNVGSFYFVPGDPGTLRTAPNASDAFVVKFGSIENISPPFNPAGCDGTVQVAEAGAAPVGLLIAPNPVHRFCTVQGPLISTGTVIRVRDMSGREVSVPACIAAGTMTLDATELAPGTYAVDVRSARGRATGRLVKQ